MVVVVELPRQSHGLRPPSGLNCCRRRSLSIQTNLCDLRHNGNSKNHLKLNVNPKKQIKGQPVLNNGFFQKAFPRSRSTPCFQTQDWKTPSLPQTSKGPSVELKSTNKPPGIKELVAEADNAIKLGLHPIVNQLVQTNQAFKLNNDDDESIAVIKLVDCSVKAAREVASYLLDHDRFSGVTPTAIVKVTHPGINKTDGVSASLQRYVPNICDGGEIGPKLFSVETVHRIGILDIRLLNQDRHTGNILVTKKEKPSDPMGHIYDLIPIDHEFCLPEELDAPYFEWLYWPQTEIPFSDYELDYVASLDPFKDAELLRSELPEIKEVAIRIHIICMIFLKKAVSAGLCLRDIGEMVSAKWQEPSMLENLCRRAAGLLRIEKSLDETHQPPRFNVFNGLAKTTSLPNTEISYSHGKMSFVMLNEEEWFDFLNMFEEILPPAFEARKNTRIVRKNGVSFSSAF